MSFFFFQAEDGIRDKLVTGVQTCALPISRIRSRERQVHPRRKSMNHGFARRLRVTSFCLTSFAVAACSHAPPADFAPDPGLIAQVRDLRIVTTQDRACPGAWIQASYEAILADGSR